MTKDQKWKVINSLVEFVERATKETATKDEIAVIAEVSKVLLDYSPESSV